MKFEFVEFYPTTRNNSLDIGTVHIYCIDCDMDIRGIHVKKNGNKFYFMIPHLYGIDESGERVRYPVINWTNKNNHKAMMNWLHTDVKPILKERLKQKTKV